MTAEGGANERQEYELVVNGEPVVVSNELVTYNEVVEIAYPGGTSDPNAMFRVDYEDAKNKPTSCALAAGGQVEVERRGTEFSVIRSVRS